MSILYNLPGYTSSGTGGGEPGSLGFSVSSGPYTFTQSSHGFSVGMPVRHTGSGWVQAQGNTIANATSPWVVTAISGDDVTVYQSGRITISGATYTPGALYYLSTTAGTTTTTKPIGTNSAPLGFFMPLFVAESATVIHLIGKGYPELDSVIAEHTTSGSVDSVAFSNLPVSDYFSLKFILSLTRQDNSSAVHWYPTNMSASSGFSSIHKYTLGSDTNSVNYNSATSELSVLDTTASGTAGVSGKLLIVKNKLDVVYESVFTASLHSWRCSGRCTLSSNPSSMTITFTSANLAADSNIKLVRT